MRIFYYDYDKESKYRNLYDKSDNIEVKIAELQDELAKKEGTKRPVKIVKSRKVYRNITIF